MTAPPVAGLLLAAGGGRRLGRPKALVAVDGELLVERGVRLLTAGGCAPVVVVLGAASDEVLTRADLQSVRAVVNEDWASGMGSSLRTGLAALEETGCDAVVVALVDQPLIGAEAVRRLVRAWQGGAQLAVAGYGGAPRNPVLMDRAWWSAAREAAVGDQGARGLLRARPELVTLVECSDTGRSDDVDTPHDLAVLHGHLATEHPDPNGPTTPAAEGGTPP